MTPDINNPVWLETLNETSARTQTVAQHTQSAHLMILCGLIVALFATLIFAASWWEQDAKYKQSREVGLQQETSAHAVAQLERAA